MLNVGGRRPLVEIKYKMTRNFMHEILKRPFATSINALNRTPKNKVQHEIQTLCIAPGYCTPFSLSRI